jgi:hypothetical protein
MQMRGETLKEFLAIQAAAEELLDQIAKSEIETNEHTLLRLEKLATAGAKLAYGGGCLEQESEQMHNLVAWCDHLDDREWKAAFLQALQQVPLCSPWEKHG